MTQTSENGGVIVQVGTNDRLFSLPEASRELGGISTWSLRKHIYQGNISPIRLGRRVTLSSREIARIRRDGLPSLDKAKSLQGARQ
jgi:hypothetical protein